jgi:hypothetical protein
MTPTGITVNVSETGGNKEWEFYILHSGLQKQQAQSYVNTWMPVTFLPKTVQYKTLCFWWNCTNSKFKRPCFSSCQCCVHTRMILTVLYAAWTSAKLVTGWRSRLSHTSTFSPLLPHSWLSHKSSMLKMPHVASTLSADEKELKSTSFLLYSQSSPHPRHHAL